MTYVLLILEALKLVSTILGMLSGIPKEFKKLKLKEINDIFDKLAVAKTKEDKIKSAKEIQDIISSL